MIVRNMCYDILQENPSSENGSYTLDPDGSGPIALKTAYCDMDAGGWTLYDNFGTSDSGFSAYNHARIIDGSTLSAANYTYNDLYFNKSNHYISNYFLQMYKSGSPQGWAKNNANMGKIKKRSNAPFSIIVLNSKIFDILTIQSMTIVSSKAF